MHFISVTGIIGAGKSSVASAIAEQTGYTLVEEDFGANPFLERYYEDHAGHAAQMQMWFLMRRLEQLEALPNGKYVIDQPLGAFGYVFPMMQHNAGFLDVDVTRAIHQLWRYFEKSMSYTQFCVYLTVEVSEALARIKQRGREYEKDISEEYLSNLAVQYDKFMNQKDITIRGITVANSSERSAEETAAEVLKKYDQLQNP
jgi:deoxyguanosine kinase